MGCLLLLLQYLILIFIKKEKIKQSNDVVFLELQWQFFYNPRSLMHGDYMRMRYALTENIDLRDVYYNPQQRFIVIEIDENNVGHFTRLHTGSYVDSNERLLKFRMSNGLEIIPNAFFIQEDSASAYDEAHYGVFKFLGSDNYLLVDLANSDKEIISP